MTKIAKLVTVTFVTRVIVDKDASDEQIFEAARPSLKQKAAEEMFENLESIVDDTECPVEKIELVIEHLDGKFHLYNEAGQAVESDFDTEEEAEQYAWSNNYEVVNNFN